MLNTIIHGDCLEVMKDIPDKSIDMILCDLPFGVTKCAWDVVIPFDKLWEQYERLIKDKGAIVLTATQPFTSMLVMSNAKLFRYEWIWEKNAGSNFATVKIKPMKEHESVLVFYKQQPTYNPIMQERSEVGKKDIGRMKTYNTKPEAYGDYNFHKSITAEIKELRYPRSVQKFKRERGLHPTQKPVVLCEYFIKTYTKPDHVVLDNCIGSGTAAIAAINTGRSFIGIEKEEKYVEVARERIKRREEKR